MNPAAPVTSTFPTVFSYSPEQSAPTATGSGSTAISAGSPSGAPQRRHQSPPRIGSSTDSAPHEPQVTLSIGMLPSGRPAKSGPVSLDSSVIRRNRLTSCDPAQATILVAVGVDITVIA